MKKVNMYIAGACFAAMLFSIRDGHTVTAILLALASFINFGLGL